MIVVSDAETGETLAVIDGRSVTWLRTGAAAAVSAIALASSPGAPVGLIGSGVNGAWAARCLAAAGFGPGVCHDPRAEAAEALAAELGWRAGSREEAVAQPVVVTCTPGEAPVILGSDLRPGQHLAVLGADGHGKREVETEAIRHCRLFCDEWEQASAGGELAAAGRGGRGEAQRRDRDRRRAARHRAGAPRLRRGDPVRLDRPGDPGPGDRQRRL